MVNYAQVDLREMLAELVQATEPYAASIGLKIAFHGPPSVVNAVVDPDKVERVAMNLVFNACKFSSAGSEVEVILEADAGEVAIRVVDRGMGIRPEDTEKIFGRSRASSAWGRSSRFGFRSRLPSGGSPAKRRRWFAPGRRPVCSSPKHTSNCQPTWDPMGARACCWWRTTTTSDGT
jgi:hypothetical protein